MKTQLLAVALGISLVTSSTVWSASPLDARQKRMVETVNQTIVRAGSSFQSKDHKAAGEAIRAAMRQIDVAMNDPSPELYDALLPAMNRIGKAHAMLELQGISLPSFQLPPRPAEIAKPLPAPTPAMATKPNPTTSAGVSFTGDVAPILSEKCGSCHVQGNKGGFSASSFAALMKGPPEGVVVFPGDVVGSRLIETIETGDMPRGGGKVSPAQLATLKQWIVEGAKFDGDNPEAMLTSLKTGAAPPSAPEPAAAMAGAPTGKETVHFARDIAPILVNNCNGCHLDAMQVRGGLQMNTLAQLLRGGDSGAVIAPGRGEESLIVKKLRGTEGDRMPAGGRPALKDSEIQLISTWISEGAVVEPQSRERSLRVVTQMAWLESANPDQITEKRDSIAREHFRLAGGSDERLKTTASDHFVVFGEVAPATLELVAKAAESALQQAITILPTGTLEARPGAPFNGKASIYVSPGRYEYSELAKMVEGRSLPPQWQSHWRYDGIQSYVAVVASDRDEPSEIESRMIAPVVSLSVASQGADLPHWFADGLGLAVSVRETKLDRNAKATWEQETRTAIASLKSPQSFFDGKLPPERADRLAAAVCQSLLASNRRRGLDAVMRSLQSGQTFDAAFVGGLNATPAAYFDAWLRGAMR